MKDKKLAGLWLDQSKAVVVKNHDAQNAFKFFLCSPLKAPVPHSDASERTEHHAEQMNKAKYFKDISHLLTNSEEVYITGPGKIQEEFKNYLHDTAQFKNLQITLDTAQHMSDEEVLKTVKNHFGE